MLKFMMYLRIVTGALLKRKSRIAIALAALIIGAGVISGLLSVYYDINNKMGKELRSYGANFILIPRQGEVLNEEELHKVLSQVNKEQIMGHSPYLYGLSELSNRKLVVAGISFEQIKNITPYWQLQGTDITELKNKKGVLIGYNAAEKTRLNVGENVEIKNDATGKVFSSEVIGIVKTGGVEDNQVFINLKDAQELYGKVNQMNVVYFSLLGESKEMNSKVQTISTGLQNSELKPIKQISSSETKIMEKIKSLVYLVVMVILLSTMLCVATTMMSMVIERRKEIGLRKALGAKNTSVVLEFLGESLILGTTGGLLGSLLGLGLAQLIGQSVFNSFVSIRFEVPLVVTAIALMVTVVASLAPLWIATKVQPALILKEN